ncbi:hypothetical protein [Corynebacterium auriscanis]|uniref:hypothetical protein n=1 Tax=Corynebacterium auriscanis TaxID=99807 RepID=UPI003CF72561
MFNKRKISAALLAVSCSLGAVVATAPTATAVPSNLKTCAGTNYEIAYGFPQVKAEFDKRFGAPVKSKSYTWQAKDDAAVWDAWCYITGSTALLDMDHKPNPEIVSDNQFPLPEDGSIATFRSFSRSGGITIDLQNKSGGHVGCKVHVTR